jgi:hypothetical protein
VYSVSLPDTTISAEPGNLQSPIAENNILDGNQRIVHLSLTNLGLPSIRLGNEPLSSNAVKSRTQGFTCKIQFPQLRPPIKSRVELTIGKLVLKNP